MLQELWEQFFTEVHRAEFSLIAARALHEELYEGMDIRDRRELTRRHSRHLRANRKHLRKAKRIRRKIKCYVEKHKRLSSS